MAAPATESNSHGERCKVLEVSTCSSCTPLQPKALALEPGNDRFQLPHAMNNALSCGVDVVLAVNSLMNYHSSDQIIAQLFHPLL